MSHEALLKQSLQFYVEQIRNIEQKCSGHTTIDTYYGQWLCKWDALILRTEACVDELFAKAGSPVRSIRKTRERTGTIIFYSVDR